MDWSSLERLVGHGLGSQDYRRVDLDTMVGQQISLPAAGSPIDSALSSLAHDEDWVAIASLFAELKLRGLGGVWIRRDTHDCEFAMLYGWSGQPLGVSDVKKYSDHVWEISQGLTTHLGKFQLVGENLRLLVEAATVLDGAPPPTPTSSPKGGAPAVDAIPAGEDNGPIGTQVPAPVPAQGQASGKSNRATAARVIRTLVDLHYAKAASTVMLAAGLSGLSDELVAAVQTIWNNPFAYKQQWVVSLITTVARVGAIDGTDLSVHGQTLNNSLNLQGLAADLALFAKQG